MISLNYHHLYYFYAVSKEGGIGRAARALNLAQPTLSAQISELERRCGRPLLLRSRNGARLTPEGEAVLRHCRRIFEAGRQLESDIDAGLESALRTLRVGVHSAAPRAAAMRVLDFTRSCDPELRVVVSGGSPEGLLQRLESRALDMAVATLDLSMKLGPNFRGRAIGSIPLVFVAAPSLVRRGAAFPRNLSGRPLLLRGADNPVMKQVELFLRSRGVDARVEAEVDDSELLRALARAGRGIAALELPTVRDDLASGRLVRLHDGPSGLRETVWLIAPKEEEFRPGAEKALRGLLGRFALGRELTADSR